MIAPFTPWDCRLHDNNGSLYKASKTTRRGRNQSGNGHVQWLKATLWIFFTYKQQREMTNYSSSPLCPYF